MTAAPATSSAPQTSDRYARCPRPVRRTPWTQCAPPGTRSTGAPGQVPAPRSAPRCCTAWQTGSSRTRTTVAELESLDTGKRFVESQIDVDDIVAVFRHFASLANADAGRVVDTGMAGVSSRIVHEPVGVCSLITPWNYPLLQTSWKVAPALAAGNTFVLKPSELTPSTAIWLMRALTDAGLPAGVANLVLGAGARVGPTLTEAPEVDLVSFTGGARHGSPDHGRRGTDGEEDRAGARWQEPQRDLRRRRSRRRRRQRPDRRVPGLGAGLLGRLAAGRRGVRARPGGGRACPPGSRDPARRTLRRRTPRPAHSSVPTTATRSRPTSRSAWPRALGWRSAAPAPMVRPSTRGTSTRPRSWTGATPRCGACRRSRSVRCSPWRRSPAAVTRNARTTPYASPTTRSTDWPARCGPRTRVGRNGSPNGCGTARSGSTTTTPTCPRPSGAVSSSRASDASWGWPDSRSTARPSTSGTTPAPAPAGWFEQPAAGDQAGAHPMRAAKQVRRRRRRWRLGRLGAGQPAQLRPRHQRARARGGAQRLQVGPVHPHAGSAAVPDRQPALRLALRVGARAAHERSQGVPRARQGARWVLQHQRDDLPAGQPSGLRALGQRSRDGDLGLRALPALLQADGDHHRRGRRLAGRVRAARARARARREPSVRGLLRGGPAGRLPAHRRRQRLPPGGLREVRPERPPGAPAQRGPGLPAPGDEAAEPHRAHACHGHRTPGDPRLRWPPGHRGRLQPGHRAATTPRSRSTPAR